MKGFLKYNNIATEKAFINDYDKRAVPVIRLGLWLAAVLYAVFGILDYFLMPQSYIKIWIIRFVIVIPCIFLTLFLTYIRSINRYMQTVMSLGSVIMGLGIVAMMALSQDNEPGFRFYYAGMMLVIMAICSIFRLRFYYSLFSSVILITGYEITAVAIQRIVTGDLSDLNYLIFINNNFFFISSNIIGLIASYYTEYSMRIRFVQQEEIKARHESLDTLLSGMKTELELARQVQSRLLPDVCPYFPGMKISSLYKPMEELGGDFYDFIRFEEKTLVGLFISDVSGHGMPAALITSMLKTLNRTAGNLRFSTPALLNYINIHLTGLIGNNFLTAIYAIYDSESCILRFSRAGHPYPVLIRKGEIKHLKSGGGIIGFDSLMNFEEVSCQLEDGDKVLFYTDGLTEEIDKSNIIFEEYYFTKVLPSISHLTIEEIIMLSYRRLIDFHGSENFEDDICILGFEVC
jgi:serine phosphatase RsbU (regulator of sigma subunit)